MTERLPAPIELLDLARTAAGEGARAIGIPLPPGDVTTKGAPGDVITQLDVTAERLIRDVIRRARPDDLVVGEELQDAGASDAALRWCIDPLDGTTNKVKGLPFYASSVAVQSTATGEWLAGAVNAPALGREYFAACGGGAWVRSGDGTVRLAGPDPAAAVRLLGTGLSYDRGVRTDQLLALSAQMDRFDDMRSVGSAALGLCLVADGSLNAFLESDLYEFDWAAGALIAQEAGAAVERPSTHRGGIVAYFGEDFRGVRSGQPFRGGRSWARGARRPRCGGRMLRRRRDA